MSAPQATAASPATARAASAATVRVCRVCRAGLGGTVGRRAAAWEMLGVRGLHTLCPRASSAVCRCKSARVTLCVLPSDARDTQGTATTA